MMNVNNYLLFQDFFNQNKFPPFNETLNIISKKASVDMNITWNISNYNNMDLCWKYIHNVDAVKFIRQAGIMINTNGGFQAMFYCLQAFIIILENSAIDVLSSDDIKIIKSITKFRISNIWNHIGSWRFYPDKLLLYQ
tara:strand:+ start:2819 stop:3232 length:414 start_codon:yes stop_codon:yes gene_type:complete